MSRWTNESDGWSSRKKKGVTSGGGQSRDRVANNPGDDRDRAQRRRTDLGKPAVAGHHTELAGIAVSRLAGRLEMRLAFVREVDPAAQMGG